MKRFIPPCYPMVLMMSSSIGLGSRIGDRDTRYRSECDVAAVPRHLIRRVRSGSPLCQEPTRLRPLLSCMHAHAGAGYRSSLHGMLLDEGDLASFRRHWPQNRAKPSLLASPIAGIVGFASLSWPE